MLHRSKTEASFFQQLAPEVDIITRLGFFGVSRGPCCRADDSGSSDSATGDSRVWAVGGLGLSPKSEGAQTPCLWLPSSRVDFRPIASS